MHLDLKPVTVLSDEESNALKALTVAVYPQKSFHQSRPVLQWAPAQWSVLVWIAEGRLLAHAGILVREGTLNGMPVKIGGRGRHPSSGVALVREEGSLRIAAAAPAPFPLSAAAERQS